MHYFVLFEMDNKGMNLGMLHNLNDAEVLRSAITDDICNSKIQGLTFDITNYPIMEIYEIKSHTEHILCNAQIIYSSLNSFENFNLYLIKSTSNKLDYQNIDRIQTDNSVLYSKVLDSIVKLNNN